MLKLSISDISQDLEVFLHLCDSTNGSHFVEFHVSCVLVGAKMEEYINVPISQLRPIHPGLQ